MRFTPRSYFFAGLPEAEAPDASSDVVAELLMTAEGAELAELFTRLPDGAVRRSVVNLVRTMAGDVPD